MHTNIFSVTFFIPISEIDSQNMYHRFTCNTTEESNSAANSSGRKFLYNSKGFDAISLLVKYYMSLANIKAWRLLLKSKSAIADLDFKFAVFLMGGAIERAHSIVKSRILLQNVAFYCKKSHSVALS